MGRVSDAKERLMQAAQDLIWENSYGSTTVDAICDRANVKKGSFYHFFDSKSDLAVAAIDSDWAERRKRIDAIFSPTVPPLERLRNHCAFIYRDQTELTAEHGCVLGCPLCTLGSEVSTQEKGLQKKVQRIMAYNLKYLETAVRDAAAAGLIVAPDPAFKARMLDAYYLGLLTQARIQNNLAILRDLSAGTLAILGLKKS
jgi:TetR/AcrR family transcriptional repressor of nem operon